MRKVLRDGAAKRLPAGYDVDTHFNPAYDPWDQRMCMVPDGDFFRAIRSGKADVVTDHIEAFTESGHPAPLRRAPPGRRHRGRDGTEPASAGGIGLTVDGEAVSVPERVAYKGMMLEGVPNLAFAIGYTNASWTLKVDLVSAYVSRMLHFMAERGYASVTAAAVRGDGHVAVHRHDLGVFRARAASAAPPGRAGALAPSAALLQGRGAVPWAHR